MKEYGIRQARARLSHIVREAAAGECSIVTDNRKPVAMIGPPPEERNAPAASTKEVKPLSDAAAFRNALLGAPFPLELDF